MADGIRGLFDRLPSWGRVIVIIAVATAIATWVITTWLPNPLSAMLSQHITEGRVQTNLLRRICENTAKSPFEAGRCASFGEQP